MKQFIILGGGIGGLSLAIAMQRKNFRVKVFESAPSFKPLGAGLALASNAMQAYREIGIDQSIIPAGQALKGMYCKDANGNTISFTDGEQLTVQYGVPGSFTIHRSDLHNVLVALLQEGSIVFGKTAIAFTQSEAGVSVTFADGTSTSGDYLIACDGIHSVVRKTLLADSAPRYAGYTCWRAVIDDLPQGFNESETTETWGSGKRFGVVPLKNHRLYWFATLNAKPNDEAMKAFTIAELQKQFGDFHFPIPQILEKTRTDQLIWGDIIDIKPIRQFAFGRIVLAGDVAHATTPNMGQGACMAIEDAVTLTQALSKYPAEEAFKRFETHRIGRTTDIVNQSWTFGRLAQLENPFLMSVRNTLLRLVPKRAIDRQLKALFDVSFNP